MFGVFKKLNVELLIIHLIIFIFVANILDAYFTIRWIHEGVASEMNPLMAFFLAKSDLLFLGIKFLVGTGALLVLIQMRSYRLVKYSVMLVAFVYAMILYNHLAILSL